MDVVRSSVPPDGDGLLVVQNATITASVVLLRHGRKLSLPPADFKPNRSGFAGSKISEQEQVK